MRLFTKVRAAVLGIAVAVGALGGTIALQATPAAAAIGSWSNTACYGGYPLYSEYYGEQPQYHSAMYTNVYIDPNTSPRYSPGAGRNLGVVTVTNYHYDFLNVAYMHSFYEQLGFECGWAGVPISNAYFGADYRGQYRYQYFIKPGSCDLRYLVVFENNGARGAAFIPNYFC